MTRAVALLIVTSTLLLIAMLVIARLLRTHALCYARLLLGWLSNVIDVIVFVLLIAIWSAVVFITARRIERRGLNTS